MARLGAEDEARLRSWIPEIAAALIGSSGIREGGELKFKGRGGFAVRLRDGAWYFHAEGRGGFAALPMITALRASADREDLVWALAWLGAHEGTGSATGEDVDDDAGSVWAATKDLIARAILGASAPLDIPDAAPACQYLKTRGLPGPYPLSLTYLPEYVFLPECHRDGHGALVAPLTGSGGVVLGVQITWLQPTGTKSPIQPVRQRYNFDDPRARAATFEVQVPVDKVITGDVKPDICTCEGVEDALSLALAGAAPRIVATLGVENIQKLELPAGTKILIAADGDAPKSGAAQGLSNGIDHLLLGGSSVWVTTPPMGVDPNAMLRRRGGLTALRKLLGDPVRAELSDQGEAKRLAKLSPADQDREIDAVAKRLGIKIPTLRRMIQTETRAATPSDGAPSPPADLPGHETVFEDVEPAAEPVTLADLLDDLVAAIGRHVVCAPAERTVMALWSAHTWVFEHFEHTPRLAIQAPQPRCGKTTTIDILTLLCRRVTLADGITSAALFRIIEATTPTTILLDEMGADFENSPELIQVLNAGFAKGRQVIRLVEHAGNYLPRRFNVYAPLAITKIGFVRGAFADRCLPILLQRKPVGRQTEKLRDNGNSAKLRELRSRLARWSGDHAAHLNLSPAIPAALNDRQGDISVVLLSIADQAGEVWGARARAALGWVFDSQATVGDTARDLSVVLLHDIELVFTAAAKAAGADLTDKLVVLSADMVLELVRMEDSPWGEVSRGRPLTARRLARMLAPFGVVAKMVGPENARRKGYQWLQFRAASSAYNPTENTPNENPDDNETTAGNRGKTSENGRNTQNTDRGAPPDPPSVSSHPHGSSSDQQQTPKTGAAYPLTREDTNGAISDTIPAGNSNCEDERIQGGVSEGDGGTHSSVHSADPQDVQPEVVVNGAGGNSDVEDILAARRAYPTWSTKRLAKFIGVSLAIVEQTLRANGAAP